MVHEALITISVEMRHIDEDGSCNSLLSHEELSMNGIYKTRFIVITGKDKEECLMNLKKQLKQL